MKILQITARFPPSIGGVEQHVFNLSQNLNSLGHEVKVLTTDIRRTDSLRIIRGGALRQRIAPDFEVRRFKAYSPDIPYANTYAAMPALLSELVRTKTDIVHIHSHGLLHSDLAAIVGRIKDLNSVLTIHSHGDVAIRPQMTLPSALYMKTLGRVALSISDAIIAISPQMARYYSRFFAGKKIHVIPNGIDFQLYSRLPASNLFRETYALRGKVVLFVGRVIPAKGVHHLIKAASRVVQEIPDVTFVIIGETESAYAKTLVDLACRLGVDSRFLFAGEFEPLSFQLLSAFSAADLFVLPSTREGLPICLLEAMASGCAIIASNVGGIPFLIENGLNGILIPPNQTQDLARAISQLLTDKTARMKLGRAARETAKHYDWSRISREVELVYTQVLQSGKGK